MGVSRRCLFGFAETVHNGPKGTEICGVGMVEVIINRWYYILLIADFIYKKELRGKVRRGGTAVHAGDHCLFRLLRRGGAPGVFGVALAAAFLSV